MTEFIRCRVGGEGRVLLPAGLRRELGIGEGSEVLVGRRGGAVEIITPDEALRRARAAVAKHVPSDADLTGDLFDERRRDDGFR